MRALLPSFPRLFSILLRNMFDRREIACSDVDSAAGIAGCVVGYETRQNNAGNIFVKLSALTTATLAAERMSQSSQIVSGGVVLTELSSKTMECHLGRLNPVRQFETSAQRPKVLVAAPPPGASAATPTPCSPAAIQPIGSPATFFCAWAAPLMLGSTAAM